VVVSVGQRKCKARNLYPYDREWAVTLIAGDRIQVRNFEQDEEAARDNCALLQEAIDRLGDTAHAIA
jgi:hypothetical protein